MLRQQIKETIKVTEDTNTKTKFECKLCDKGTPHLMCIMSKDGDVHVHAPFSNRYLMTQFIDAIIEEQRKYSKK